MDVVSKPDLPHQPKVQDGGKMKDEAAQRRDRKALKDIGNVGEVQGVQGKPQVNVSRPMTRGYYAQLQACANGGEKNKKPVAAADGKVEVKGKGVPPRNEVAVKKKVIAKPRVETLKVKRVGSEITHVEKKSTKQPEPESVIVISSDEEEFEDAPVSRRKSRDRSSRRNVKTLTSSLTARSQAVCGLYNEKPKGQFLDIDAKDVNNELAVVEYLDDLYKYYKLAEDENRVHDYMAAQPQINEHMRSVLVGWLVSVHRRYELMPESLYLTINIVDRYLSKKLIKKEALQLVGIGSMLIACKYEEVWPPQVEDFVHLCDDAYSEEQVLVMEKIILENLGWYLTVPTPYVFLVRYIKASVSPDKEMEDMVFFLAELGLLQYSNIVSYCPSLLAAAAVYAACHTLNKIPAWNETLRHYTGYTEKQLMGCAKDLVRLHLTGAEHKSKPNEVFQKFTNPERGAVALLPPAKSLLALLDAA